jgi:hypothetical protein
MCALDWRNVDLIKRIRSASRAVTCALPVLPSNKTRLEVAMFSLIAL